MKNSNIAIGYFRKVYRSLQLRVPHTILKYLSIQKLPQKRSHQSIYLANSQKKIYYVLISLQILIYVNIYFKIFSIFFLKYHIECT